MSPLSETLFTVKSIVIFISGIFIGWPGISQTLVSMVIFIARFTVCLSPALGWSLSTLRGSAPASRSFTWGVDASAAPLETELVPVLDAAGVEASDENAASFEFM